MYLWSRYPSPMIVSWIGGDWNEVRWIHFKFHNHSSFSFMYMGLPLHFVSGQSLRVCARPYSSFFSHSNYSFRLPSALDTWWPELGQTWDMWADLYCFPGFHKIRNSKWSATGGQAMKIALRSLDREPGKGKRTSLLWQVLSGSSCPLWSITAKNTDWSTESLARSFARTTRSFALELMRKRFLSMTLWFRTLRVREKVSERMSAAECVSQAIRVEQVNEWVVRAKERTDEILHCSGP